MVHAKGVCGSLVVMLLVGCGGDVGKPCSLDDPCSDGVCDFTDPNGPVCIDGDGDLDGDGITNSKDFCNHEPGGAFDEDRDGIGDECDKCPIAAPLADPDPDGDEVDSPCDPDPRVAGDQIAIFEGFNTPALPAGFMASANWQFLTGEVIATADAVTEEEMTTQLPLVSQQVVIFGQYRIDNVNAASTQNLAGVLGRDERPAGGSEIRCSGTRTGGTDRLILITDTMSSTATFADLFDAASLYRVTLKLDRTEAGCAMIADDEEGAAQATTGGEAMNRAGLVARGVTARFQFLLVVQRDSSGGT